MRLLIVLLSITLPVPIAAQDIPTRIGRSAGPRDFAPLMESMAKCAVQRKHDTVTAILRSAPNSSEELALKNKLLPDLSLCIDVDPIIRADGAGLRINPLTFRRSLASNMLARDYPTLPEQSPVNEQSLAWFGGEIPTGTYEANESLTDLYIGRCTISRDWRATRTFLLSKPGSKAEQKGLQALAPTVVPCVPHDFQMTIKADFLRGILAESTYYTVSNGAAQAVDQSK